MLEHKSPEHKELRYALHWFTARGCHLIEYVWKCYVFVADMYNGVADRRFVQFIA